MSAFALEWLHLLARWIHVLAAILWVGDSFLFMWMDRSLVPPSRPREGAVTGELWLVHSGGFYEVVKRRFLAPAELPPTLHWFKWEAYTTWITGIFLLGLIYYLGHGVYLVDPQVSRIGYGAAVALSLGLLVVGWLVYDGLWRSPLARRPAVAALTSLALLTATAYGLTRVYSGRAAYLELGAMMGTLMAANVWRVIIPAQSAMLAATRAGRPVDTAPGERAKRRSTHNHYMTLPVLFTMLSNHFPITYGHPLNWLVLVLIAIVGASLKYTMNFRARSNPWLVLAGVAALGAVVFLTAPRAPGAALAPGAGSGPLVRFPEVRDILDRRCLTCHSARPSNPAFPQPPAGVVLTDPRRVRALAPRILERAVITKTMPLGNLTGMTDEERATLGRWIGQGARLEPPAPDSLPR